LAQAERAALLAQAERRRVVPGAPRTAVELERVLLQVMDDADLAAAYVLQLGVPAWRKLFVRRSMEPTVLSAIIVALDHADTDAVYACSVLRTLGVARGFAMAAAMLSKAAKVAVTAIADRAPAADAEPLRKSYRL
jgi:hypothetical protein